MGESCATGRTHGVNTGIPRGCAPPRIKRHPDSWSDQLCSIKVREATRLSVSDPSPSLGKCDGLVSPGGRTLSFLST